VCGAPAVRGAPAASLRAAGGRGGGGAGCDEQEAADGEGHAGDVGRVQPGRGDVQPVRHDTEPGEQQAEGDGEAGPRGARHMRPREDPGQRRAEDHRDAERRRRGAGERQLEEVRDDERQPGDQERALQRREALAPRPAERRQEKRAVGRLGRRGGGRHRRSLAVTRPGAQPARRWAEVRPTGVRRVQAAGREASVAPASGLAHQPGRTCEGMCRSGDNDEPRLKPRAT
jgi:hypothetical protein